MHASRIETRTSYTRRQSSMTTLYGTIQCTTTNTWPTSKDTPTGKWHHWSKNGGLITHRVRSIDVCPVDDTFLTAGDDATVRLWDLRSPECKGLLRDLGGSSIAAFDNTGKVFAVVCSETHTLMLYSALSADSVSSTRRYRSGTDKW